MNNAEHIGKIRRSLDEGSGECTTIPGAYPVTDWREPILQGASPYYKTPYSAVDDCYVPAADETPLRKAEAAVKAYMPRIAVWAPVAVGALIALYVFAKNFL